jgi:hypothetical protein
VCLHCSAELSSLHRFNRLENSSTIGEEIKLLCTATNGELQAFGSRDSTPRSFNLARNGGIRLLDR